MGMHYGQHFFMLVLVCLVASSIDVWYETPEDDRRNASIGWSSAKLFQSRIFLRRTVAIAIG